jgi:hypothetical protein
MDEKGFLQGFAHAVKRIMTRKEYDSGRVRSNRQDGSREFITLIAAICADGTAVPPALIYKGASGDLQSSWVEEVGVQDEAFFGSSPTGWSNNEFGLVWLEKVFHTTTIKKAEANRCRRLLIVDGHSSHVNIKFLDTCDRLRIIVLILPPHATHRLQPLDVGLFGPLASYYSFEINELMRKSGGLVQLTKRMFWGCFKKAWDKAFSVKNIESAFAKTGYWPFNSTIVLIAITPVLVAPQSSSPEYLKTPKTSKSIRQFQIAYRENPSPRKFDKLMKAAESLAAETAIQIFRSKGLEESLVAEKKKRQRGKKLGLNGKELNGGAQLFGVPEIEAARQHQATIEVEKQRLEQEKEQSKIDKAVKKTLDNKAKEDRRIQREINTQMRKEAKAQAKADRIAAKQVATTLEIAVAMQSKSLVVIQSTSSDFLLSLDAIKPAQVAIGSSFQEGVPRVTRSGRPLKTPQHLL